MDDQPDRPVTDGPRSRPGRGVPGSRRARVAGVGVAVAAVGVAAGAAELVRAHRAIPAGSIRVNGVDHQVRAAPDTPPL